MALMLLDLDAFLYHLSGFLAPGTPLHAIVGWARVLREGLGYPLFTWTVRTAADLATARTWADAPIFEGLAP